MLADLTDSVYARSHPDPAAEYLPAHWSGFFGGHLPLVILNYDAVCTSLSRGNILRNTIPVAKDYSSREIGAKQNGNRRGILPCDNRNVAFQDLPRHMRV